MSAGDNKRCADWYALGISIDGCIEGGRSHFRVMREGRELHSSEHLLECHMFAEELYERIRQVLKAQRAAT